MTRRQRLAFRANAGVVHRPTGILGRVLSQPRVGRRRGWVLVDFDLVAPMLVSTGNLDLVAERYDDAARWLGATLPEELRRG